MYIDTHSGAGLYDLTGMQAEKTGEYKTGISRLQRAVPQNVSLKEFIKFTADDFGHNKYPGSPEIARRLCRENDDIYLMELHNSEIENLKRPFRGRNVHVHHRDGFEGLIAITPPKPARGLVLIDPPYEQQVEYQQVHKAMTAAVRKWATGIYAIWYPLLGERAGQKSGQSEKMIEKLSELPVKNVLNVKMTVEEVTEDSGMYGSGMLILNAPYQLDVQLNEALPELASLLSQQQNEDYTVEWLKRGE